MKIISNVSHVDHDLTLEMLAYLKTAYADRDSFFVQEIELPEYMGTVSCGLYGPAMGDDPIGEDEVVYRIRGNRKCASRMKAPHVLGGKRQTRKLTVVGGPAEHNGVNYPCVLYTAYGGPMAPREPGDVAIPDWAGVVTSREFWAKHCLVES